MGAKIVSPDAIRTTNPALSLTKALPTRLSVPSFRSAAINCALAASFTLELEQKRSLKNEEQKREKSLEKSKKNIPGRLPENSRR